jgi:surfeit locus 1 family protein
MTAKARAVSAAIAAALGIVVLIGLGTWQVQRLHWKEGLIASIEIELAKEPAIFDELTPEARTDFTKVMLIGVLDSRQNRFLMATYEGGAGWQVVTPLLLSGNRVILIDRGTIPESKLNEFRNEAARELTLVKGILRLRRDEPNWFTPENDPIGNRWYWWDVAAILNSLELPSSTVSVPIVVQRLPDPGDQSLPKPQPPSANLANNHLGYAITWFGFAVILAVIATLFIRQQTKKSGA